MPKNLEKSKYLFYGLIYTLDLIKLVILKAYIKTNLVNNFIWLFKFFANIPIIFD